MTDAIEIHRIVVALDSMAEARATLEGAARLAANLKADLKALFVEDINVLRLSDLPVAEVQARGGAARRPDQATLRRELRAAAGEARRQVARVATGRRLNWSFEVAQGPLFDAAIAAAGRLDLVALGRRARRPPARRSRAENLAWSPRPVVAVYDGSDEGRVAVTIATGQADLPVTVVVPGAGPAERQSLVAAARRDLGARAGRVGFRPCGAATGDLLAALRETDGRLFLLPERRLGAAPGLLQGVLDAVGGDTFLVCGGG